MAAQTISDNASGHAALTMMPDIKEPKCNDTARGGNVMRKTRKHAEMVSERLNWG